MDELIHLGDNYPLKFSKYQVANKVAEAKI